MLKPGALAGFLAAAAGLKAEVVTAPGLSFSHAGAPRENWDGYIDLLPSGANLTLAAFENCLGDGCFLIDRARFLGLGGFAADASDALRNRLLLTQAVLAGATLEVAPAPLFWRREAPAEALTLARLLGRPAPAVAGLRRAARRECSPRRSKPSPPPARARASASARRSAGLGGVAHELALKLSFMPQRDSAEQNRPFLDYCLARGRFREAFAFAQWLDDPELQLIARAAAETAAETLGARRRARAARPGDAPRLADADRRRPRRGVRRPRG